MKTTYLMLAVVTLMLTATSVVAQDEAGAATPFGKKLPASDHKPIRDGFVPGSVKNNIAWTQLLSIKSLKTTDIKNNPDRLKQILRENRNILMQLHKRTTANARNLGNSSTSLNADFHLTKDIDALTESFPNNSYDFNFVNSSYAVLNGVVYFAADDGIHGSELWRSDGTDAGTYMLKDIESGEDASGPYNITAVNGKIYFAAYTTKYGQEPWVSDGTGKGTQLLMDVKPGTEWSYPTEFVSLGNTVYFVTDNDFSSWNILWKTDGTTAGTIIVKDFKQAGYYISQLMVANGLMFFTFLNYNPYSWELWRSNGTNKGTYHIGTSISQLADVPAQLTGYNNQLYFSSDDGSGRKLWVSDGTDAGTTPAPKCRDVLIDADYFGISFPVLDNTLYVPATSADYTNSKLYKYDAFNNAGLVKVKNIFSGAEPYRIVPSDMRVVNNTLYFKAMYYKGHYNDQADALWSSKGSSKSTQVVQQFPSGEVISNLYDGNGSLYFVRKNKTYGTELWTAYQDSFKTNLRLVSDIFKGPTSSNPAYLTAGKGKLFFGATDDKKGTELFMTNGTPSSTSLVKDINTTSTSSSYAAYNNDSYHQWITPFGNDVLFGAYENVHGFELYRSDGTNAGTHLLHDVLPGELPAISSLTPDKLVLKNNEAYFVTSSTDTSYAIYKTDGTTSGLRKLTPDIYVGDDLEYFDVANNGLVFYGVYNFSTRNAELWCSDGTEAGTILLSTTVYSQYKVHTIGNTAFFVANDAVHGFELWKSNGTIGGTGLVKDINPGSGDGVTAGVLVYNDEIYFGGFDGADYGFWKTNGTTAGTIKLKNIYPWFGFFPDEAPQYYCISNNILYFGADKLGSGKGTELWKTDGTSKGTQAVKDINPHDSSYNVGPYYLTDVNGVVFFVADDGVHGTELWKTDGTNKGTQLVKDLTPGSNGSSLDYLVSCVGRLLFLNTGILWSSNGTSAGTAPVDNDVINNVEIVNLTSTGSKLFLSGYTHQYGYELYEGQIDNKGVITMSNTAKEEAVKTTTAFNAMLYPNPVVANAQLLISGSTAHVSVAVTDMSGKKLWQSSNINAVLVNLPTAKLAAGTYLITVTNGKESKVIKLVKQ